MDKTRVENIDCMIRMRETPDKFYELAIVDPEYGLKESRKSQTRPLMAKQKNGNMLYVSGARKHKTKSWDDVRPSIEYFVELQRISKNQIIWGGNHFADLLPARSGWVIWDKLNESSDQSDCELAWTSFKTGARKFTHLWNGFIQGSNLNGSIAEGNKKLNEERIQPAQKPIKLYKWLLKNYAKEGDKILDTHGGSMSSVIACLDMGYSITCYELDPDYYTAGKKRIEQYLSQQKIFDTHKEVEFIP